MKHTEKSHLKKDTHIGEVSTYIWDISIQYLCVIGTMTECTLRRGIHKWDFQNVLFVCDWDHDVVR